MTAVKVFAPAHGHQQFRTGAAEEAVQPWTAEGNTAQFLRLGYIAILGTPLMLKLLICHSLLGR